MARIIVSPGSYIQSRGELKQLARHYRGLGQQGAYLIVDRFIDDTYHAEIVSSFEEAALPYQLEVFGGECSEREIQRHTGRIASCDAVIGIGGGKTLDTAKAVAFYAGLPVMIVPTTASSDAPCSRLSVVYNDDGSFRNYLPLPANPNIVLMDVEVIARAPVRFLAAGIGDALATWYEAAACEKANAETMAGGHTTQAALALARLCFDTLLAEGVKAVTAVRQGVVTRAVENILEANTYLSGIGFESSGLAAAHAIHNGLTTLPETHSILHGEKVAFGTLCMLVLENRPLAELEEIISFCRAVGLPTTLGELGLGEVSDERLMQAAAVSCAENDTMGNMPFEVAPDDVFAAMKVADRLAAPRA